jgi:hypothetical protein
MLFPSYVSEWPTSSASALALAELLIGGSLNGCEGGSPNLEVGLDRTGQTPRFERAHSFGRGVADGELG